MSPYESAARDQNYRVYQADDNDGLWEWAHEVSEGLPGGNIMGGGFLNAEEAWRACCADNKITV